MIRVGDVILTEREWDLGQGITDDEFNAIYRPWLGGSDLVRKGRQTVGEIQDGRGSGEPAADCANDAGDPAAEGET
jgi:hypothetical protein